MIINFKTKNGDGVLQNEKQQKNKPEKGLENYNNNIGSSNRKRGKKRLKKKKKAKRFLALPAQIETYSLLNLNCNKMYSKNI